jgi:hypothetical protein
MLDDVFDIQEKVSRSILEARKYVEKAFSLLPAVITDKNVLDFESLVKRNPRPAGVGFPRPLASLDILEIFLLLALYL